MSNRLLAFKSLFILPYLFLPPNLDNYIKIPKQWTENNKAKLQDAVREDALRKLLRDPMHKVEKLLIKGKVCQLEEEKHVVMEEMQEVKTEMDLAKRTPDSELFQDRNEEFDWMRISAQSVRKNRYMNVSEVSQVKYLMIYIMLVQRGNVSFFLPPHVEEHLTPVY